MAPRQIGITGERPLGSLGIGEAEERLYRWLLARPGASAQQIAEALPFGLRKIQQLLNSLEIVGFVTHSPERPRRYIPASPDIAITALVRRRREELDEALRAVPDLRRQAARSTDSREQVVELITSREAERQIFEQMPEAAQEEIITLERLPMLISRLDVAPEADHPSQRKSQERGVSFRSIVDASLLGYPGALRAIRGDMKAGEEVRVISHLPFKMVIADRRTALIPLNLEQSDSPSLLVRSSALLDALYSLFEILWERAAPISFTHGDEPEIGEAGSPLPEATADLVALLCAGLNDKAIVQELGVSQRTLLRRVSELMKYLGARTRFQAGWLSALRLRDGERGSKPDQ